MPTQGDAKRPAVDTRMDTPLTLNDKRRWHRDRMQDLLDGNTTGLTPAEVGELISNHARSIIAIDAILDGPAQ